MSIHAKHLMFGITVDTVQQIIDYIEQHLYERLTPQLIASHFYIHSSTMNQAFKLICNMTPMEYIRNRRLSLAADSLISTSTPIIELAYQYGYETPEDFTKAFTRFHGFPPSLVRRTFPETKQFHKLQIKLEIQGGWHLPIEHCDMTKSPAIEQDISSSSCYDEATQIKGGFLMNNQPREIQLHLEQMEQQEDWQVLLLLAAKLEEAGIAFKADGKSSIFAHGLQFKPEKIGLTFKWKEEEKIKEFFGYNGEVIDRLNGYKYFDTSFEHTKVRCMFYGSYPFDQSDQTLYLNTDIIHINNQQFRAQSLQFYYENAKKDDYYYAMVERWLLSQA